MKILKNNNKEWFVVAVLTGDDQDGARAGTDQSLPAAAPRRSPIRLEKTSHGLRRRRMKKKFKNLKKFKFYKLVPCVL